MTTMDRPLRATPLYLRPALPTEPPAPSYRMDPGVAYEIKQTLRKVLIGHGIKPPPMHKPKPLPPEPDPIPLPEMVNEALPEAAVPPSITQVYDRLLRVLNVTAADIAGPLRGPAHGTRAWWKDPTLPELRGMIFAVMRSHEPLAGKASLPELSAIVRPRAKASGHSTALTCIRRWSRDGTQVERAMELARRAGLGELGMDRVKALAEVESVKKLHGFGAVA